MLTGDAEAKFVRVVGKETFEEGALAHAGGPRDDEGAEKVRGGWHGVWMATENKDGLGGEDEDEDERRGALSRTKRDQTTRRIMQAPN